jgi:AraC-like DNA-binding protein
MDESGGRLQKIELVQRATALAPMEGVNASCVSGVWIMRASSTSQPLPALYEPCLCFVLQGRKRACLDGEMYVYDPLNYLVVSVPLPLSSQILEATADKPYLCLRLAIDITVIADLLGQVRAAEEVEAEASRGLFVARTNDAMFDAVLRLVKLLEQPHDAAALAPLVIREIYYRALTGEWGQRLTELCSAGAHVHRVARAIHLVKSRFDEPLSIESLARAVHMSPSSLHHHFKAVTSMAPLQFQKQIRLHEARRLMLAEGLDATSAGHRVGYESPSQFNREYRRLFGAPPRREIEAVGRAVSLELAP